eukprot:TRINITY_DN713_c0_g4_i1.p1 TRINITY_DN713_c0_g4~~TRINITY_DN713_c0_g4_i1.p1  ORF type:complete len:1116 (+),score=261.22 TRINITY_DN713_c0_g4_i1:74-3421(+)
MPVPMHAPGPCGGFPPSPAHSFSSVASFPAEASTSTMPSYREWPPGFTPSGSPSSCSAPQQPRCQQLAASMLPDFLRPQPPHAAGYAHQHQQRPRAHHGMVNGRWQAPGYQYPLPHADPMYPHMGWHAGPLPYEVSLPGCSVQATEWLANLQKPPAVIEPTELAADKGFVHIYGELRFGAHTALRAPVQLQLTACNSGMREVKLAGVVVCPGQGEPSAFRCHDPLGVSNAQTPKLVAIPPGGMYSVSVECRAQLAGRHAAWVVFSFLEPQFSFRIGREATAEIAPSRLDGDAEPFCPLALRGLFDIPAMDVRRGHPPPLPPSWQDARQDDEHWVPDEIMHLPSFGTELLDGSLPARARQHLAPLFDGRPGGPAWWRALLWLEEAASQRDMRMFDLYRVQLRHCKHCPVPEATLTVPVTMAIVAVPGLPERRPHLCYGDQVWVRPADNISVEWLGHIYGVRPTGRDPHVVIGFESSFGTMAPQQMFHVRFAGRRTKLRRCHAAVVAAAHQQGPPLYGVPAAPRPAEEGPERPLDPCPGGTELNEEQIAGVRAICTDEPGQEPYLVYGPPGTGKTRVIVEAARRLICRGGVRVLIAAPTDAAADVVCDRLASYCGPPPGRVGHPDEHLLPDMDIRHAGRPPMLRLYALQRRVGDVPTQSVIPFTWIEPDETWASHPVYGAPSRKAILGCAVVVASCSACGILREAGAVGVFSHVFVDEAGQATEPESLIPLTLAATRAVTVLSGDYMQLGPALRSSAACASSLAQPLDQSLLERLHRRRAGSGSPRADRCCVLVRQYRGHETLLDTSSGLFYHGLLKAAANADDTNGFLGWKGLPNPEVPFMFIGRGDGEDHRDGDASPSWFNLQEVESVVRIAQGVINDGRAEQNDVNVIAPFRTQVYRIRHALRLVGLKQVRVGTVEDYQGQEGRVIILSTVRSRAKFLPCDVKHRLGIVFNRRRFNVSISRARALLVVVGSPLLLCKDPVWRELLRFALDRGCYVGNPPPETIGAIQKACPPWASHGRAPQGVVDPCRNAPVPPAGLQSVAAPAGSRPAPQAEAAAHGAQHGEQEEQLSEEAALQELLRDLQEGAEGEVDAETQELVAALRGEPADDAPWNDDL